MLIYALAIIAGFALLVWGADRFVLGSAATARNLGVSTLIIGLTIVAFGTSAPEILVSIMASSAGNPGLAIGNAIGSNITNIALVLGITAIMIPLTVRSETLRRELPILGIVMLVSLVLLLDHELDLMDSLILLGTLVFLLSWIVKLALRSRASDPMIADFNAEIRSDLSLPVAIAWLVVGLMVLLASSRMLVWGAVNVATELGVSDLLIGLTIVALGTSLPELAASVIAAYKKEDDIAIGNIVGSNLFNILLVLGIPGLFNTTVIEPEVLWRDYPVMIGLTLLLFVFAYGFGGGPGRVSRKAGGVLITIYISYMGFIYYGMLT